MLFLFIGISTLRGGAGEDDVEDDEEDAKDAWPVL